MPPTDIQISENLVLVVFFLNFCFAKVLGVGRSGTRIFVCNIRTYKIWVIHFVFC